LNCAVVAVFNSIFKYLGPSHGGDKTVFINVYTDKNNISMDMTEI